MSAWEGLLNLSGKFERAILTFIFFHIGKLKLTSIIESRFNTYVPSVTSYPGHKINLRVQYLVARACPHSRLYWKAERMQ